MKKEILTGLIFEEKRQKALEKKPDCKFIRIDTSNAKNGYDLDYQVGTIETFIDEFKDRQSEKLENKSNKKIKKLEDKIKEKEEESSKKIELEDKNKNSTTNQITHNFGEIIMKN